jgi:hypothetical protein
VAIFAVMAFPRTGSSMTAGILAEHGVWTGDYRKGDDINAKGHFENLHFKQVVKKYKKTGIHRKPVFDPDQCFLDDFMVVNPEEPWLIKSSVKYWKLFDPLTPIYLCVRRSKNASIQSCKRVGLYFDGIEKSYDTHMKELDYIVENKNGINIQTEELIAGDFHSIGKAFDCAGMKFDKELASKFVDRKLWHFK